VKQPSSFNDFKKPNDAYKLNKVFYGLKQAQTSWYETLSKFFY